MVVKGDFPERFKVVNSTPDIVQELEDVQRASFPTISEEEIMTADMYRKHIEVFPEGQFAVIDTENGRVAGCSTDFRCDFDFDHIEHSYLEASGHNWLTTHNPEGEWLYGADIGVHPDYRGCGLSTMLYKARHDLIRKLNLRGHVAGGLLSGYGKVKDEITPEDYIKQLESGEVFDPTVSIQLRRGFKIRGIIQHYVDDPSCDNKAALIVWENPDYKEEAA